MNDYTTKEFEKVMTVVEAALQNPGQGDIEIRTRGFNPSASVTVKAYVLKKFLTKPEGDK